MISDFILVPVASYVICNICPRSEPIYLGALQEEKLLVCSPFPVEYRKGVLLDNAKGMCGWIMCIAGGAVRKAVYAEVVFITCAMRTAYADLINDCLSTSSALTT